MEGEVAWGRIAEVIYLIYVLFLMFCRSLQSACTAGKKREGVKEECSWVLKWSDGLDS